MAPPMNVVHILLDDAGWGDLGSFNGHPNAPVLPNPPAPPPSPSIPGPWYDARDRVHHLHNLTQAYTPNMDALAKGGTVFADFHSAGAVCSPSRVGWVTGRVPATLGVHNIWQKDDASAQRVGMPNWLNTSVHHVARLLRDGGGYSCAHYGKWSHGVHPDSPSPGVYGYDDAAVFSAPPALWRPPASASAFRLLGDPADPWWAANSSAAIVTETLAHAARAAAAGKPFYVSAWLHVPHTFLDPSPAQLARYPAAATCGPLATGQGTCQKRIYWAALSDADAQIGRLVVGLHALGGTAAERTLLLLSSDNGPAVATHNVDGQGSAGPFRGRKGSLYEGGTRAPLIARCPGCGVVAGRVDRTSVFGAVDWLPTVAKLAGIELPAADLAALDGVDASAALLGGGAAGWVRPADKPLRWDYRFTQPGQCWDNAPQMAVRQGELKLLANLDGSRTELYRLPAGCGSGSTAGATAMGNGCFEGDNLASRPEYNLTLQKMLPELLAWGRQLPASPQSDEPHPACAAWMGFPS
jgi:arylsulfatase A-like enzyme